MTMSTILITGAGRGLGRKLVASFVSRGWQVFGLVRKESDAGALAREYSSAFQAIVSDVTSDQVDADIRSALDTHGSALDVLVNNAGIPGSGNDIETLECEVIQSLLDVHLLGALRCARACMPFLKLAPRPLIVNMTSRLGSASRNASGEFAGMPFSYSYRIAKAAQNMFTLCLSQDASRGEVRACGMHPGRLKTDSAAFDADRDPAEAAERLAAWVESADDTVNGRCFDLFATEMEW